MNGVRRAVARIADLGQSRLLVTVIASALTVATTLLLSRELRDVAVPAALLVNIAIWFTYLVSRHDAAPPVFELGPLCVAFTTLYAVYPLVGFVLGAGTWTALSDNRLQQWSPGAEELGTYAWRYVLYLAALALSYLVVRGRQGMAADAPMRISGAETFVIGWLVALILTYFTALGVLFGVSYNPAYDDVLLGRVRLPQDLPLAVQQISQNLRGMLVLLKLCVVAVLLQHWQYKTSRLLLAAWLLMEVVATAMRMGGRTDTLFLLVAAALLYHRLVRPLTFRLAGVGAAALLVAAVGYGLLRDLRHTEGRVPQNTYWTAVNEFQVILGTGFDLHKRRETGTLADVPWQVRASEVLMLVPSQLLPFPKVDPAEWYLQQLGLDPRQVGLMFGALAQAAVGLDWLELALRGMILGVLFGLFHRFYIRRAHSAWWTLLYLYVCLWSYYTVRASSFYFVYFVLYRFLPTLVMVWIGSALVRRAVANLSLAEPDPAR